MGALGGLVFLYEYVCVAFYEIFLKTGVNCNYIQNNGGLG